MYHPRYEGPEPTPPSHRTACPHSRSSAKGWGPPIRRPPSTRRGLKTGTDSAPETVAMLRHATVLRAGGGAEGHLLKATEGPGRRLSLTAKLHKEQHNFCDAPWRSLRQAQRRHQWAHKCSAAARPGPRFTPFTTWPVSPKHPLLAHFKHLVSPPLLRHFGTLHPRTIYKRVPA